MSVRKQLLNTPIGLDRHQLDSVALAVDDARQLLCGALASIPDDSVAIHGGLGALISRLTKFRDTCYLLRTQVPKDESRGLW
jgi:hypothetical protein